MANALRHPRDKALIVLCLLLLAGAGVDRLSMIPSRDATRYHARVREARDRVPMQIGPWVGSESAPPVEALDLLKPNAVISRAFETKDRDKRALFLLVQCSDVRDMISHYPPVCYPNRGLVQPAPPAEFHWDVDGLEVNGTEYQFESATFQSSQVTVVDNFMVLPDGRTTPNMEEITKYLKLELRYFGMAQVQIVFDGTVLPEKRKEIAMELIKGHRELIDVIRSGVRQ